VPIFLPLVVAMGYSPIWFGIMMVMIIEMGGASPPFGINIFVIKSVAGDIPLTTIYKGILPFIVADFIRIALVLFFPILALFLPSLM
jgi:C4-dicarboxylate transporter DctM subunit